MAPKEVIKVLVTGAAGQIGYSLLYMVANGDIFGHDQPLDLVMLDIEPMMGVLEGVAMELNDCAFTTLRSVVATADEKTGFSGIDAALLVGAMPRKAGMERKDLLAANVRIFKSQGKALDQFAKKTVKVIVVGNPANTNAGIAAKYAPSIPTRNFSAMTRLDQNRAQHQIAAKCGVTIQDVSGVIVWGNHSSTQFPDVSHAKVNKGGKSLAVYAACNDDAWLKGDFIKTVQSRGAAVIAARKLSSAMSAAKACADHMRDWFQGTKHGHHVSMAVPSDGSYGVPAGLIYSFPVTIENREWKIVQGLEINDFGREKMKVTADELAQERADALAVCQE
ncbi:PREDICTED: malate dehydrogenase, cytoplasmic-like [Priapulus caudatus]|uniref:Malate dehydrogenase n=1 Tax=Priapulus caudatus TaxID=37621 RepID=A0ABM1DV12_PRICU|nr:PREDICTED: malate dehydrogenase, cytoplasmic-like [Priapulus caudatus]